MMKISQLLTITVSLFTFWSCTESDPVYPKPLSAMKIDFPAKEFTHKVDRCDYQFLTAEYTKMDTSMGMCNLNLNYSGFNASLFLTYIPIDTSLKYHIENSRKLVYDHSIKADGIEEKMISNAENRVFGTAYKLIGNAASNYQFYVTDSTEHFLRGALYFNCAPNFDSLKPFIEFLLPDFDALVNTLTWVNRDNK